MARDIPLGRIAGMKVGMHPLVLGVAGLLTWSLAVDRFPFVVPGHASSTYWIAGACGAVLLMLSLLVHEIGHGLVARDEHIGVHSMGLTVFGGVTRMESAPTTPGAELRVSVIGPLASLSWGIALLCLSYICPNEGSGALVGAVLEWAGVVNLILAAFNLIPATPLDGGKVLSSLIWMRTKSQATAIRWTARAGIAAGAGMLIFGLRSASGSEERSYGLMFAFIGAFVLAAAWREHQGAPLYDALEGVTVADAMAARPPVAAGWSTVADFVRSTPADLDHRTFPVVGPDGQVLGVLTADAIQAAEPHRWATLQVQDLAFPLDRIVRLTPADPLLPSLQRVDANEIRAAIVVDGRGEVVGTVDPSALHRAMRLQRAGLVDAGH